MEATVEVPQWLWEKILHTLEFDVSWAYRNEVLRDVRQHFDGPEIAE